MMGLGVARNVVVQQRDALARVVDGQTQMDDNVLLDIAGALLYVDASLDDQVASLGADPGDGTEVINSANSSEVRRTVDVLAQQAIANFGAAREHFVAFIETNWDHARLANVPHLLGEVGGALRILELPQAADYLEGVRGYVDLELICKQRVPSGRQLDTLADAMASLEYYLEALRERRPGREEILDITRNSLETLRYWPLPSGEPSDLPIGADQPGSVAEPQTVAATPLQHADTPQAANDAAPTPSLEWVNETVVETPFAARVVHDTGAAATDTVFSFDPVAAEETVSGQSHVPFTVAPLDLSDDGAQAPGDWQLETTEQVAPIATSAFDPVSAEQDGNEVVQVSYTVDLSALEQEHAAEPVVAEDAPLQIEQIALPGDAEQTEAPLDFIAENATRRAQTSIEDAFSPPPLPPQELDDPFVEPVQEPQDAPCEATAEATASRVQQAVVSEFELDDASAAFLAPLDAAAAQFDVQQPQATTVPADAETAQASSEPVSSEGTQAATAADAGIFGGFGDSDIDDDIRDVFLEEFDEELVNLGQLLPVWRAAPNNPEHLRPIRRVFHTLKGSGRLVGASVLGEFSWKIESMLNRVLDNSRPASPALVAMVELAYDVLPQFNAALRNQGRINADLPEIQAIAERVAAGEEVYYVPAAAAPVADAGAIPAATSVVAASGGTPASVDSVLREILEAEVATHLDTVNGWLQASQAEPQLPTEELLRAVHTMSGAFAMTDVPEITLVTTPAESYVKRLLAASVTPSAAGLDAIAATAAAIATTVTALRADAPLIPSFAPLTERLRALVDTLPEAQWPPQVFLDELDDVDAPSDTVDDNNASVELTGAQDLSQYLDASALPFDAPAPAQDTEDTQPQSDDAPIAVDALADAEAEHDSALAVDAPASHTVDDLGHLASHEHVDASAESAHAPSDDALVPAVVSAQLADAISTHADTVAVEEPADAEAALGDAQTLAAADAEQATDTHAQHVPTHDDQGAAGADDAVESSEALASVYTGTALAEDADATNAEDWTPGTPALDSVPTDQEGTRPISLATNTRTRTNTPANSRQTKRRSTATPRCRMLGTRIPENSSTPRPPRRWANTQTSKRTRRRISRWIRASPQLRTRSGMQASRCYRSRTSNPASSCRRTRIPTSTLAKPNTLRNTSVPRPSMRKPTTLELSRPTPKSCPITPSNRCRHSKWRMQPIRWKNRAIRSPIPHHNCTTHRLQPPKTRRMPTRMQRPTRLPQPSTSSTQNMRTLASTPLPTSTPTTPQSTAQPPAIAPQPTTAQQSRKTPTPLQPSAHRWKRPRLSRRRATTRVRHSISARSTSINSTASWSTSSSKKAATCWTIAMA